MSASSVFRTTSRFPAWTCLRSLAHLHGGPAPVRRFLPELIELICNRQINPGKVFDLELPLGDAAEGYEAMDERRAIKALLRRVSARHHTKGKDRGHDPWLGLV